MTELLPGWSVETDRGPNWLFVRLHRAQPQTSNDGLANSLWRLLECDIAHRMLLEFDSVVAFDDEVIDELVELDTRIRDTGGILRLAGVSDDDQDVLRLHQLECRFPQYPTRRQAVMG